jgi:hypothetical protein
MSDQQLSLHHTGWTDDDNLHLGELRAQFVTSSPEASPRQHAVHSSSSSSSSPVQKCMAKSGSPEQQRSGLKPEGSNAEQTYAHSPGLKLGWFVDRV